MKPNSITAPSRHTTISNIASRITVAIKQGTAFIGRADAGAIIEAASRVGVPIPPALTQLHASNAAKYPSALVSELINTLATTPIVAKPTVNLVAAPAPAAIPLADEAEELEAPLLAQAEMVGEPVGATAPAAITGEQAAVLDNLGAAPGAGGVAGVIEDDPDNDGAETVLRPSRNRRNTRRVADPDD